MFHGKLITILQYFTDKVEDYWHILYPIVSKEERSKDRYLYFYDISKKALEYNGKFNENGIYLFYGYDGKYHLYPLEIAQYALACWLAWRKTNDKIWLDRALLHCDWLIKYQEQNGSWRMEHKNPNYFSMNDKWSSALAQGLAISALIRAYYYTNHNEYLNSAKLACKHLDIPVKYSGVKREFKLNGIKAFIYEEYPTKELNGVLNGYISAILGIWELYKIDDSYQATFLKNIDNLKKILPLFDTSYWSYYSLDKNIASGFYHRLHINQLKILGEYDNIFVYWSEKWEKYLNNKKFVLKAFINKIKNRKY